MRWEVTSMIIALFALWYFFSPTWVLLMSLLKAAWVKAAKILLFANSTTTNKLGTLEVYYEMFLFFDERDR